MYLNGFRSSSKSCILTVFQSISTFFNLFDIYSSLLYFQSAEPALNSVSLVPAARPARPPLASESPASHHRPSVCRPPTPSRELASERRPPAIRSKAPAQACQRYRPPAPGRPGGSQCDDVLLAIRSRGSPPRQQTASSWLNPLSIQIYFNIFTCFNYFQLYKHFKLFILFNILNVSYFSYFHSNSVDRMYIIYVTVFQHICINFTYFKLFNICQNMSTIYIMSAMFDSF